MSPTRGSPHYPRRKVPMQIVHCSANSNDNSATTQNFSREPGVRWAARRSLTRASALQQSAISHRLNAAKGTGPAAKREADVFAKLVKTSSDTVKKPARKEWAASLLPLFKDRDAIAVPRKSFARSCRCGTPQTRGSEVARRVTQIRPTLLAERARARQTHPGCVFTQAVENHAEMRTEHRKE
jgi:hypothetical protein